HADAVLGLDQVLIVQPRNDRDDIELIPFFLTQFTKGQVHPMLQIVPTRFPYLVEGKPEDGDEDARAAQLVWKIIDGDVGKPFVSSGLEFVPLPGYICLGFLFGRRARVVYLSDLSRFVPSTEHGISKSGAGQLDLLILEANILHEVCLDAIKRICPRRALLTGMNHEFEHHRENHILAEWSC
uniref:Metallo-beta-lactamase domain-containing protein n=1 Tax=Setaria italica TaxID=4555 RepID=A0A0Q3V190_SETIT